MKIRLVTSDDAELFRDIRLRALQDAPEAFGMSAEEYLRKSVEEVRESLASSTGRILVCEESGRFVGMAGVQPERGVKRHHIALVWGVYLEPSFRGSGVANDLLARLIAEAKEIETVEILHLAVAASNTRAIRFYERMEFSTWGTEKRALKVGGRYLDEHHMALEIRRTPDVE